MELDRHTMTRIFTGCFLCLLLFSFSSFGATVTFTLSDFTTAAVTNKVLKITSLSTPRTNSTAIVITDQRTYRTDGDGVVTVSNMVVGDYKCELLGPWAHSIFTISVPDSNDTFEASEIIASGTADVGALVGYTQAAADAKFVAKTNSFSQGQQLQSPELAVTNSAAAFSVLPLGYTAVIIDTTAGAVTNTMPGTSFVSEGRWYRFKNAGANPLRIAAAGSDKIDGDASITLTNQYDSVDLVKQSTNWWRF